VLRWLAPGAGLVQSVREILHESGVDPSTLVLEITESALMGDAVGAFRILNQLKALGVRLAIDDFGTGYSSLVYPKRFPVDLLKTDMGFIRGLGQDPEDSAIDAHRAQRSPSPTASKTPSRIQRWDYSRLCRSESSCGSHRVYRPPRQTSGDRLSALETPVTFRQFDVVIRGEPMSLHEDHSRRLPSAGRAASTGLPRGRRT
jgi:hypothetical protein